MLYLTRNGNRAALRGGVDRMLDEMTRAFDAPAFEPVIDVAETEANWTVRAELPGIDAKDVEVTVTGNVLTLKGEKRSETASESEGVRRAERRYGKFARTLEFPTELDAAKVEAHAKNGVLTISLPKAEASRPRTVAVKVE